MANIKSNIKTKKQSDKRYAANKAKISNLKAINKKARSTNDAKDINKTYKLAASLATKRVIHKNKANRIKSRLAKAANKAKATKKVEKKNEAK